MNKEEKEAIAFLRRDIKFRKNNKWLENCIIEPKTAQILLNYIDKLQKENREYEYTIAGMVQTREDYFIPKYKIRDKIKELEEIVKAICEKEDAEDYQCEEYYKIQVLKELLGE